MKKIVFYPNMSADVLKLSLLPTYLALLISSDCHTYLSTTANMVLQSSTLNVFLCARVVYPIRMLLVKDNKQLFSIGKQEFKACIVSSAKKFPNMQSR